MIELTKLDGTQCYINPHQIERIDMNPDTTIIMMNGRTLIVSDRLDAVLLRIQEYRYSIYNEMRTK